MTDLETRIAQWADEQVADVEPVTLAEIHDRATTIPLDADPLPAPPRRFHSRPLAVAAVVILVAATIGAALLFVDGDDRPVVTEGDDRFAPVAGLVPHDRSGGIAVLTDHEGARREAGIDRPPIDASTAENDAYLAALLDSGLWPLGGLSRLLVGTSGPQFQVLRDELGIEPAQITGSASWGGPPDIVTVLTGRFDPDSIDAAVRNLPDPWSDALEVEEHRGVSYYSWFPDFEIGVERALETNRIGTAMRLAVVDDIVVMTHSTESMTSTLDHIFGDAPSDIAALVSHLDSSDHTTYIYMPIDTIGGQNAAVSNAGVRTSDDAADIDAWAIHVGVADDPEALRQRLDTLVDDTAAGAGWQEGWRELVEIDTVGQVVRITIPGNVTTRSPDPGGVRETVGERLLAQLINGLIGGL